MICRYIVHMSWQIQRDPKPSHRDILALRREWAGLPAHGFWSSSLSTLPFPFIHFTCPIARAHAPARRTFVDRGLEEAFRVDGRNARPSTRYLNYLYTWRELIIEKVKVLKGWPSTEHPFHGRPLPLESVRRHVGRPSTQEAATNFWGTDYREASSISSPTPNNRRLRIRSDSSCDIPRV